MWCGGPAESWRRSSKNMVLKEKSITSKAAIGNGKSSVQLGRLCMRMPRRGNAFELLN